MQTFILLLNSTNSNTILGTITAENSLLALEILRDRLHSKGLTDIHAGADDERTMFFFGYTTLNMECDECPTTKENLNQIYPSLHATGRTHYIYLASPEQLKF